MIESIIDRFRIMPDKEIEQAKTEIANSYRSIQGTLAFRHLLEEMEKIYAESLKSLDQCAIAEFTIAVAAEGRGMRRAIGALKRRIKESTR